MTKERELLKKVSRNMQYLNYSCNKNIRDEITELLAQPEQEPLSKDLQEGISLRDHFAGLAMQGLVSANPENRWGDKNCAKLAYQQADAMLKERE